MIRLAPGEWGRVYAAATVFVAEGHPTAADLAEVLVDGQRGLKYGDAVETVEAELTDSDGTITETEDGVACHAMPRAVEDGHGYPEEIVDREYWVTWALDSVGRKRPRAPWKNGHAYPAEWRDSLDEEQDPKTTFDEAKKYADLPPATVRNGYGAPPDLVDYQVPGVQWLYGEKQRAILAHVRENPGCTAREVAENTDATKEHVRNTLEKLEQYDMLSVREGAGDYGADLHRLDGDTAENGVADTKIANSPVWSTYTLRLAIDAVHLDTGDTSPAPEAAEAGPNAQLVQFGVDPPS